MRIYTHSDAQWRLLGALIDRQEYVATALPVQSASRDDVLSLEAIDLIIASAGDTNVSIERHVGATGLIHPQIKLRATRTGARRYRSDGYQQVIVAFGGRRSMTVQAIRAVVNEADDDLFRGMEASGLLAVAGDLRLDAFHRKIPPKIHLDITDAGRRRIPRQ